MSRKVLFLTLYYPPDLCAGSFRAAALSKALLAQAGEDVQVDVITGQPSRYASFSPDAPEIETRGALTIRRVLLPARGNGFLAQVWLFLCFALAVLRVVRGQRYDLVVATSSRLMTACLGSLIAWRKGARLYLDIRDILVETLKGIFTGPLWRPVIGVFVLLERWTMTRADRINLVSRGFLPYFQSRYPQGRFSFFSNGVDSEFLQAPAATALPLREPLKVLYAGNIGDGQGLHNILPGLALRLSGRACLQIIGDGGRACQLSDALAGMDNVELLAPMRRKHLRAYYEQADVLFLHLNDYPAFKRVLPSKLFEYAATGKPIWAGVAGYAAEFIAAELTNAAVFAPCDVEAALEGFERLALEQTDRSAFVQRYARERIMDEMARDILQLLGPA
ncbi:glycosyltransferase family 4 protein [Pseudomonas mendocina]|nr:glycosyltransferase family 4 protein [Pseudomonas mendocina]MBH3339235.1 glycosyltransferase family 4 protein [Pseudomonas mendocina]